MPGKPAHASSPTQQRVRLPLNWSLILGLILVVIVLYFAFMGPNLAPADPMRENYIAKVNGAFVRPPFPAFTVPGYPLGSDEFGRDILSRLLCGIKPTLMVGLVVAGIRLLLGVVIGVLTGWFSGRFSAALRWLTGVALSAPVIFFAIFIISLLGQSMGLWAFVIGLSLTGWAETARLISEQTRLVKVQPYVKAADALGATSLQTLILHVLPQVVSLVWVMLAFEISSSILSLAGLGVIGYFISFIWIQNGDWTTLRASGKPELGQLLAGVTSMDSQPWGVIAAGTVVFLIILSFNLLGEGIRRQLRPEAQSHHKGWIGQAFDNTGSWIEDQLVSPTSRLRSINPIIPAAAMLAILLIGGGAMLWRGQAEPPSQLNVSVPGGALWASSQHDAHATRLAAIERIDLPEVEWVFANPNEKPFSTNPVVSVDGTIYLVDAQGMLYAVRADGGLAWSVQLPNPVWVSPAIGTNGEIYLADETASLMAYSHRVSIAVGWKVVAPEQLALGRDSYHEVLRGEVDLAHGVDDRTGQGAVTDSGFVGGNAPQQAPLGTVRH
ncbi:MAG TPA: ABC transporter permease subunit [Anaerolineaceae bacterium]|nr:ABC transporter permease subunit [Anaerolineaceae bacterium]